MLSLVLIILNLESDAKDGELRSVGRMRMNVGLSALPTASSALSP